jgi:acetyltransferase-like isoleucine patch superfamily enzyme
LLCFHGIHPRQNESDTADPRGSIKVAERVVRAVHGKREDSRDAEYEIGLANQLRESMDVKERIGLYARFATADTDFDALMRRAIWRATCRSFGHGVRIGPGVGFKHLETFEIGDDVFIGGHAFIQGRFDGTCRIGSHVWIGPQCYFDARDMVLEDYVGMGPGSRVLGSQHTGYPTDVPVIQTDLVIKPVVVKEGADIGTGAVILPGVTVGQGALVGANSLVMKDVPRLAVVAGVPARLVGWRDGQPHLEPEKD